MLAAYRGMREAQVAAFASPTKSHPEVEQYAFEKLLGEITGSQLRDRLDGVAYRGRPTSRNTEVTAIDLAAAPATAVLRDCFDTTHWVPFDVRTGRSVAVAGTLGRHPVTAKARVYAGRWVIVDAVADRSRRC